MIIDNFESVEFIQSKEILQQKLSGLAYLSRTDLTLEQKNSITEYKLNSSDFNGFLRKDDSILFSNKKVLDVIPHIDRAFELELSRVPFELALFRGIPYDVAEKFVSNYAYLESGFVSTTFDLEQAYDYSKYFQESDCHEPSPDGFVPILLVLCNEGDKALYLGEWENEILLNRGLVWTILSDIRYVSITIIPMDTRSSLVTTLKRVRFIAIERR